MVMRRSSAAVPTCCCRSVPRPGRTCSSEPCSPSNCSARHQSLRTTPIIVKDRAMLRSVAVLLLCPLLAASALAQSAGEPLDAPLKIAQAEQAAAEAETAKLENAASQAHSEADRLHAEQAAAAQAIEAAEARISAANVRLQLAAAYVAAHQQ